MGALAGPIAAAERLVTPPRDAPPAGWRRWIDVPPFWLAGFAGLAWVQGRAWPVGPGAGPMLQMLAGLLVGGGLLLAVLAVAEMRRNRTTPIPHREAEVLVTSGVFRLSRNPIYLGDLALLAGLAVYWSAWPSLLLVPALALLLTDRFILAEEARLAAKFGDAFDAYTAHTRRWL